MLMRIGEEIRMLESRIRATREGSDDYVPTVAIFKDDQPDRFRYALGFALIDKSGRVYSGSNGITWGFGATKNGWLSSAVESYCFGYQGSTEKVRGFEKAKNVAFGKALKLANIISKRANVPVILQSR